MPLITLTSGPAHIIGSGMITSFGGHPLTLTIEDPVELVLELVFETDPEQDGLHIDVTRPRSGEGELGPGREQLRMRCINFDTDEGRGSAEPVLLGESGDDLVFFHFRVFRFGKTVDHTVHYTLYIADKETLGWVPRPHFPQ
jgi:hypothetical protein